MDYIKGLRSKVGNIPLLLAGSAVIITDGNQRLLLQYRADTKNWGFPAGYMEIGESPEDAARREVYEETGLQLGHLQLFGLFSGQDHHIVYPNGDQVYSLTIVYHTSEFYGDIQIDNESLDLRFFDICSIPSQLFPIHKVILLEYLKTI